MSRKHYKLNQWYPSLPEEFKHGNTFAHECNGKYFLESKHGYYHLDAKEVENNPEFWEEVEEKNYEILKVKAAPTHYAYSLNTFNSRIFDYDATNKNLDVWDIYSVKRLSDNEVFTVGDIVEISFDKSKYDTCYACSNQNNTKGKIKDIQISSDNNDLHTHESAPHGLYFRINTYWIPLQYIDVIKELLFTTEDDIDIYKNDKYWLVTEGLYIRSTHGGNTDLPEYRARFSTKKKAEQYVDYHRVKFSEKDIENAIQNSQLHKNYSVHIDTLKYKLGINES